VTERDDAIAAAKEQIRAGWQSLADASGYDTPRGTIVTVYEYGFTCDRCSNAWDGFWQHEETRVCRDCGNAVLSEVMGTNRD
jgi:hypothetical protein